MDRMVYHGSAYLFSSVVLGNVAASAVSEKRINQNLTWCPIILAGYQKEVTFVDTSFMVYLSIPEQLLSGFFFCQRTFFITRQGGE